MTGKSFDKGFSREKRIRKRKEFLSIQDGGIKKRSHNFLFIARQSPEGQISRLGITVSKKVDKRATERNKIKRRIREVYRKLYPFLEPNWDVVVIAMREAQGLDYRSVKSELNFGLRKLGVLPPKSKQ